MEPSSLSAVSRFKEALERYGLQNDLDGFLIGIRSSLLSDGNLVEDLSEEKGRVLQQLGVGWPNLTDTGLAIARELVDTTLAASLGNIEDLVATYPPKVVQLFLQAASRGRDVFSLRIPQDTAGFDQLRWTSNIVDLIRHARLQPHAVSLGENLERQGLAVNWTALAYRGAKYQARFVYVSKAVAHKLMDLLTKRYASLGGIQVILDKYALLRQNPLPTLQEFKSGGVSRDRVEQYVHEAWTQGAITKLAEQGPAFLVLDAKAYDRLVLEPEFNRIIDLFFEKPLSGSSASSAGQPGIPTPTKIDTIIAPPIPTERIVIGAESEGLQWGVLGKSESTDVIVDLNAPHVAFVCGKMGAGKGYTIGVLCEMLASPTVPNLTSIQHPATIIVLYKPREDLASEFATIVQPNDDPEEVNVLRNTYGQAPKVMTRHLSVFIDPFVYEKNRSHFQSQYSNATVRPLHANPSSMSGQEWSIVLAAGGRTDQLYIKRLFAILEKLQYEPFDLQKLMAEVINDPVMDNRQKNLARQRIGVLQSYLAGPAEQDFVANLEIGGVNVFDFRQTIRTTDDVFSLMTLIISILQTKKGLESEPFVFVINEAHDYFKGGVSGDFVESIEHLIRRRRHGKNWLLLDTHFPDDVDSRVVELADLKFVHYLDKATTSSVLNKAFGYQTADFPNLRTGEALIEADKSSRGLSKVFKVSIRPRLTKHGGATKTAA